MPDIDFFDFYRYLLAIIVTIYVIIVTGQWAWGWYVWLTSEEKYVSLLRRYLFIQAMRLRFKAFWGDVLICLLLCVVFGLLWRLHTMVLQGML